MARKGSKSNQGGPKEKSGKKFRNQFWSSNAKKDETVEEPPKRPESSVSRQFQPKKQQGVSEAWSKQSQESVSLHLLLIWITINILLLYFIASLC